MRYVTRDQLMAALSCTPQNLYGREGKTLPLPIILDADGGSIRAYDLADLLWIVGASERELICTGLGLDVHRLRVGFAAVLGTGGVRLPPAHRGRGRHRP